MSHFSNDLIADRVISNVADMSDFQVLDSLSDDFNIASLINAEDVNNPDAFMENKRNLLVELMFEQEVEIPGPWG
tara:strand:- start:2117 stop:2341 length:225 start_codon:yes stop_codon:yes gene_type:complete